MKAIDPLKKAREEGEYEGQKYILDLVEKALKTGRSGVSDINLINSQQYRRVMALIRELKK